MSTHCELEIRTDIARVPTDRLPPLLLTIERPRVGEHLHPDVAAVSLDVRERPSREVVDECRGVLTEHRDVRTCSIFIKVAARSRARALGSANVPVVA